MSKVDIRVLSMNLTLLEAKLMEETFDEITELACIREYIIQLRELYHALADTCYEQNPSSLLDTEPSTESSTHTPKRG